MPDGPAEHAAAVTVGVEAYRRRMRRYTTMPEVDIWVRAAIPPVR